MTADRIRVLLCLLLLTGFVLGVASPAVAEATPLVLAQEVESPDTPEVDPIPVPGVEVNVEGVDGELSRTVSVIISLTIATLLPSLMVLMTSFTRFVIVLGLTRNAIGVQSIPPAPVIIGISLFLTLFVMAPILEDVNENALQPMLAGEIDSSEAFAEAYDPLRTFMLAQTEEGDLRLFMDMAEGPQPASADEVPASTLIPAFVVSELRAAFVIGFVIFVPFLVIDLIVASVLMSLGMVMLPPAFVSLPLKLLLFVLVDGWVLIIGSVVASVNGVPI